jgi:hypothetical protein
MGAPVKLYDLYLFHGDSEVIVGWHKLEAVNNAAAIKQADEFARIERMELWEGSAMTKRWESPESIY